MNPGKQLVFVDLSKPEDSKTANKRKLVRSQAAKDYSQSSRSKTKASKPRKHRKLLTTGYELELHETQNLGNFILQADRESSALAQRPPLRLGDAE